MALVPVSDVSAADWLVQHDQPWPRLPLFGPPVFEAYARLRFVADPTYEDQPETFRTRPPGYPSEMTQLRTVADVLALHTRTPRDAYFCLWEGWGDLDERVAAQDNPLVGPTTRRRARPAFPRSVPARPGVRHPHRAYYLFRGPLADLGVWGAADIHHGVARDDLTPAFVWPADQSWCIANDVDPHWAGIGARAKAIADLVALTELDIVRTDPSRQQPSYD